LFKLFCGTHSFKSTFLLRKYVRCFDMLLSIDSVTNYVQVLYGQHPAKPFKRLFLLIANTSLKIKRAIFLVVSLWLQFFTFLQMFVCCNHIFNCLSILMFRHQQATISLFYNYSKFAFLEKCHIRPIDVVFVIDGSRSVRPHNFQLVKNFVKNFTEIFDDFGPNHLQVGVVSELKASLHCSLFRPRYSKNVRRLQYE